MKFKLNKKDLKQLAEVRLGNKTPLVKILILSTMSKVSQCIKWLRLYNEKVKNQKGKKKSVILRICLINSTEKVYTAFEKLISFNNTTKSLETQNLLYKKELFTNMQKVYEIKLKQSLFKLSSNLMEYRLHENKKLNIITKMLLRTKQSQILRVLNTLRNFNKQKIAEIQAKNNKKSSFLKKLLLRLP